MSLSAAAEEQVVAALAEQRVVAGLAEEHVGAGAAGQHVVAGAAEEVRPGQRAVGLVEGDGVVAAVAEDLDQPGVGDGGGAAEDRDGAAVDEDVAGRVAADGDRVVLVVAEDGEDADHGGEDGGDGELKADFEPSRLWLWYMARLLDLPRSGGGLSNVKPLCRRLRARCRRLTVAPDAGLVRYESGMTMPGTRGTWAGS